MACVGCACAPEQWAVSGLMPAWAGHIYHSFRHLPALPREPATRLCATGPQRPTTPHRESWSRWVTHVIAGCHRPGKERPFLLHTWWDCQTGPYHRQDSARAPQRRNPPGKPNRTEVPQNLRGVLGTAVIEDNQYSRIQNKKAQVGSQL